MEFLLLLPIAAIFLLFLKIYLNACKGVCKSKNQMEGKVVIVTGATSGIGYETALELAKRKATVILACRNMSKGEKAVKDIITLTGNKNVSVYYLDLSSLESVKCFAKEMNKSLDRLDVLIHNAGCTPKPGLHLTKDNLELQFATNHFGPFLLNHLLLDLLKKSAPSRIIVVSSITHLWARMDLENLNCEKYARDPYWIYCSTKLANILFVRELAKKLEGTGVTVNTVHPGGVRTNIFRNARWFIKYLVLPIVYPFFKSANEGAQTSIYLAVADEVKNVSGLYFVDCSPSWTSPTARNGKTAKKLWEISEKLTGIK